MQNPRHCNERLRGIWNVRYRIDTQNGILLLVNGVLWKIMTIQLKKSETAGRKNTSDIFLSEVSRSMAIYTTQDQAAQPHNNK